MISRSSFRVLVVDDDSLIRRLCKDALAGAGYEVEVASNGLDALERLKEDAFDVVITDMEMPVMSGKDFYERAIDGYGYLKDRFIFMSGNLQDPFSGASVGRGTEYFAKPFNISSLVRKVDDIARADLYSEEAVPKRKEKRLAWQEDCFVTEDVLNIPIYSQTLDISSKGLKIRYRGRPFTPDSSLSVFIRNPGIQAHGVIRWSKALNSKESLAGLEFKKPIEKLPSEAARARG